MDLPGLMGEFGAKTPGKDETGILASQLLVTERFIQSAKDCGFLGALAWGSNPAPSDKGDAARRFTNLYGPGGRVKDLVMDVIRAENR